MKIQETKQGQKFITIPSTIAEAMGIKKGDKLSITIQGKNKLMLEKAE